MEFDSARPCRKSIRLKNYDYSQARLYFITICTHQRLPLYGLIGDGQKQLNAAGKIAAEEWRNSASIRSNVYLHEFVVMPNHVHGIIELVGARCTRPDSMLPDCGPQTGPIQQGLVQRAPTVGDVVRGFKSVVTKRIRSLLYAPHTKIWQRNYYEHIIRNEAAYLKISDYIQTNPQRWLEDTYHV